jgi:hypothetical protein
VSRKGLTLAAATVALLALVGCEAPKAADGESKPSAPTLAVGKYDLVKHDGRYIGPGCAHDHNHESVLDSIAVKADGKVVSLGLGAVTYAFDGEAVPRLDMHSDGTAKIHLTPKLFEAEVLKLPGAASSPALLGCPDPYQYPDREFMDGGAAWDDDRFASALPEDYLKDLGFDSARYLELVGQPASRTDVLGSGGVNGSGGLLFFFPLGVGGAKITGDFSQQVVDTVEITVRGTTGETVPLRLKKSLMSSVSVEGLTKPLIRIEYNPEPVWWRHRDNSVWETHNGMYEDKVNEEIVGKFKTTAPAGLITEYVTKVRFLLPPDLYQRQVAGWD